EPAPARSGAAGPPLLDVDQLTVLTAWAEAVAEALAHAPERVPTVLAEARSGAGWRSTLGLEDPAQSLDDGIDFMRRALGAVSASGDATGLQAIASLLRKSLPREPELGGLVRRVLLAMIEQRGTRQP